MRIWLIQKKKMKTELGVFLKKYKRKKQRNGEDSNDRSYDRKFEDKLKRMKAEDIQELFEDF